MIKKLSILILFFISNIYIPSFSSSLKVQKGDNLTKIANENNTTIDELIKLNNLKNNYILIEGQTLLLPKRDESFFLYTIQPGDNLLKISKFYNISLKELTDINNISNQNLLIIGEKIKIPKNNLITTSETINNEPDIEETINSEDVLETNSTINNNWILYGPIKINSNSWRIENGAYIANSVHSNGKPLSIAINCSKKIINRTGINGAWREWISPIKKFEFRLIEDRCNR